ncbi:MAG: hypothetical protein LBV04_05835 [Deferribacteraceae bacterium]|nr:hypothetical protein [Deferribacteraceae bacterium]
MYKQLLREKRYDEALPLLRAAAEGGSAEAQYDLGYAYYMGEGVARLCGGCEMVSSSS